MKIIKLPTSKESFCFFCVYICSDSKVYAYQNSKYVSNCLGAIFSVSIFPPNHISNDVVIHVSFSFSLSLDRIIVLAIPFLCLFLYFRYFFYPKSFKIL